MTVLNIMFYVQVEKILLVQLIGLPQIIPKILKELCTLKTNIGVKKTTDWLVEYCEKMNWKLQVREPNPPNVYDELVLKYGFPGAGLTLL